MYQHIKDHSQTYSQRPGVCECKNNHNKKLWQSISMPEYCLVKIRIKFSANLTKI